MSSKYVVIQELSRDNIQCLGIFKSYLKALGFVHNIVTDQKKEFAEENDIFEYSDPIKLNEDNGIMINVTYKKNDWTTIEKPKMDRYIILTFPYY